VQSNTLRVDTARDFQTYGRYINPIHAELLRISGRDQRFVRAEGCSLFTDLGEKFADWVAGFGALNLGHNPRGFRDLIDTHLANSPPNLFPESLNPFAGALGKSLIGKTGEHFKVCFFSNSGSEAVEAAIKAAIAATRRNTILYCEGAYHGTTMGALSAMGAGPFREKFEPLLPYVSVPWNDTTRLVEALERYQPAALILEPIQVDAGVRVANPDYLRRASSLCHDFEAFLILDEVQTGMGRTGTLFAFQQTDVRPDILVLGKSLGAGLLPIGATLYRNGIFESAYGDYLTCEAHNSTFGGNALACVVALEVLQRVDPNFLQQVQDRGNFLFALLQEALQSHPIISNISMKGLIGGITLRGVEHPWFTWENLGLPEFKNQPVTGPLLVHRMHKKNFLTQICAHDWNTLRIEPPLIVSDQECKEFVATLREELDWILSNS
jgi:acetylornithine/succinyldiaminopimelate/putrescine aminotransferase